MSEGSLEIINILLLIIMWSLEMMAVLYSIHCLFGKQMIINGKLLTIMVLDISVMFLVYICKLSNVYKIISYFIIVIYFKKQYEYNSFKTLATCVIGIVLSAFAQVCAAFVGMALQRVIQEEVLLMLVINAVALLIIGIVFRLHCFKNFLHTLHKDMSKWKEIIVVFILMILFMFWDYWYHGETNQVYYLIFLLLCIYICVITIKTEEEKFESEKRLLESKLQNVYGNVYQELVNNVRMNQHDFKNQLSALYSMHLTSNSLEELIQKQKEYGSVLLEKCKYDDILTSCNNEVLAGYIYYKCLEIEKKKIQLVHKVKVDKAKCALSLHEIIESMGILLINAVEAVISREDNRIIDLLIEENSTDFIIQVANSIDMISTEEIHGWFQQGYSSKEGHSGLGLVWKFRFIGALIPLATVQSFRFNRCDFPARRCTL